MLHLVDWLIFFYRVEKMRFKTGNRSENICSKLNCNFHFREFHGIIDKVVQLPNTRAVSSEHGKTKTILHFLRTPNRLQKFQNVFFFTTVCRQTMKRRKLFVSNGTIFGYISKYKPFVFFFSFVSVRQSRV